MSFTVVSCSRRLGLLRTAYPDYLSATGAAHDLVELMREVGGAVTVAVHGPKGRIWSYEVNPNPES